MGEAITRDTKTDKSIALRLILGIWCIYCFVIASGYAAVLRSFLIKSEYNAPINTLKEVIKNYILLLLQE